jgi:hypothetical protein
LSEAQIPSPLGLAVSTVKSSASRGFAKLRVAPDLRPDTEPTQDDVHRRSARVTSANARPARGRRGSSPHTCAEPMRLVHIPGSARNVSAQHRMIRDETLGCCGLSTRGAASHGTAPACACALRPAEATHPSGRCRPQGKSGGTSSSGAGAWRPPSHPALDPLGAELPRGAAAPD